MKKWIRIGTIGLLWIGISIQASPAAEAVDDFAARRSAILEKLDNGIAVVPSQSERRGRRLDNKSFFYLVGAKDRNALLLLTTHDKPGALLFNSSGTWTYDATQGDIVCRPISELQKVTRGFLRNPPVVYLSFSELDVLERLGGGANPFTASPMLVNLDPIIQGMRVLKSDSELGRLGKAIDITAEGIVELMKAAAPGMKEFEMAAVLEYEFARRGSPGSTFLQAASGPNSTFVHFGAGERVLAAGDMIVVDVGAEYQGYTADITRSFPASGRFTLEQKAIYSLVLAAQKAGIERLQPGGKYIDAQKASEDLLMYGLAELGLVTDVESPWQKRLFIQHGFYHFIGLDIHDVWYGYARGIKEKRLEPGMIITWEPGLYFPTKMLDEMPRRLKGLIEPGEFETFAAAIRPIYDKYADIGVRIEDDVVITAEGHRVVSAKVPKEIPAVEKLMKQSSRHHR